MYCGVTSVNRFKIAYKRCKTANLSPAARAGSASGGRVSRRFQPVETVDSTESRVRASAKSRSQPFEVEKNRDVRGHRKNSGVGSGVDSLKGKRAQVRRETYAYLKEGKRGR